jgi:hypothetical protein
MESNGGVMSAETGRSKPILLTESGPVAGWVGALELGRLLGQHNVVAFDMGGTTAKCALVQDGRLSLESTYYIGGYEHGFPVQAPVVDILEVGAGGGSIAWVDEYGALQVGPCSAGAEPGPVCFGKGGASATSGGAEVVHAPGAEPVWVEKASNIELEEGAVVTVCSGGGGGYGDPWERDPALVERDVQYGYVSVERARSDYGCVVDAATLMLDAAATVSLRAERQRR